MDSSVTPGSGTRPELDVQWPLHWLVGGKKREIVTLSSCDDEYAS